MQLSTRSREDRPPGAPPARLFVLGATGGTGRHVVGAALERGYAVTAFARSRYQGDHHHLRVVEGDARDAAVIAAAIEGHDAVAVCLGSRGLGRTTVRREGARALVQAMRSAGVERVVVLSEALAFTASASAVLGEMLEDVREMETTIRESALRWTIVRAARLTNGSKATYVMARESLPGRLPATNRVAAATAMLDLLEQAEATESVFAVWS